MNLLAIIVGGAAAIVAWFATNFLGQPILALRAKRREALHVAERYSHVDVLASDALRGTALKSLHDTGNDLLAYSREASVATRLWCWLMGYDLEFAARYLFALAENPRGEYSLRPDQRKTTLDALYVCLAATRHLSPKEIEAVKSQIEIARHCKPGSAGLPACR